MITFLSFVSKDKLNTILIFVFLIPLRFMIVLLPKYASLYKMASFGIFDHYMTSILLCFFCD